ncbi:DUF302 domain-containing protein [bacterium]|nr:DUF302 domain-containing protein [bacterium]
MKKRDILFISGGFIGGLIITLIVIAAAVPGLMMIEHTSPYDFETAVSKFEASVKAEGWSLPHVHDLKKSMAKFGHDVRNVKVFELCHPDHASKILKLDDERIVSSLMPCRVAIYEKSDGKVYVSSMNTGLMSKMMGGIVPEVMADASKASDKIISAVLQ